MEVHLNCPLRSIWYTWHCRELKRCMLYANTAANHVQGIVEMISLHLRGASFLRTVASFSLNRMKPP